jgi:hypothetical protein
MLGILESQVIAFRKMSKLENQLPRWLSAVKLMLNGMTSSLNLPESGGLVPALRFEKSASCEKILKK